jgi:hypothetical protein
MKTVNYGTWETKYVYLSIIVMVIVLCNTTLRVREIPVPCNITLSFIFRIAKA